MSKLNLRTLAANFARAKTKLTKQEMRVTELAQQLVHRVGTGGATFATSLGVVSVTQETADRTIPGFNLVFSEEKFLKLDPKEQLRLQQLGVVHPVKKMVRGQRPRVQFRSNT